MSPRRTTTPSDSLTTSCRNSSGGAQIGIGDQIHGHHRSLGPPERREIVVACQRVAHHRRRNAVGRHQLRLEPDAHGKGPVTKDVGALNAGDGAQFWLHDASQIVGNLVLIEVGRRKTEVQRRELVVGVFDFDDRRLGLGRQLVAHLRHLRLDLRQGVVGVVVEPKVDGDRAETLAARRFHVVDAIGAGDDPLERCGDETADEIRIRARVNRRHAHHRDVTARVLPDTQRAESIADRRSG